MFVSNFRNKAIHKFTLNEKNFRKIPGQRKASEDGTRAPEETNVSSTSTKGTSVGMLCHLAEN